MRNGQYWRKLLKKDQDAALLGARIIDGQAGNDLLGDGECIIDFENGLSVPGEVVDGEITIKPSAMIYDPENPATDWAKMVRDARDATGLSAAKLRDQTDYIISKIPTNTFEEWASGTRTAPVYVYLYILRDLEDIKKQQKIKKT